MLHKYNYIYCSGKVSNKEVIVVQFYQKNKLKLNNSTKEIFPLGFHDLNILYLTIIVLKSMECEICCI